MSKTLVQYGGPSYIALRYASMRNKKSFTAQDVYAVFSHKFSHPYMVVRSLNRLVKHGLLSANNDKWTITPKGLGYLRATALPYNGG